MDSSLSVDRDLELELERTKTYPGEVTVFAPLPDEAPDGGYGWVIVASAFWNTTHTWGIISTYGVFLAYYLSHNVIPGASSLEFALIGGFLIAQALLVAPIATYVTQRWGIQVTILSGVVFETGGLIAASFSTRIWQLFLSLGVCFGWGVGMQYTTSVAVVPQWFTKRRALASGIVAAGSGTGGLIYGLAANAMIGSIGLPWAYRVLAIVHFVVNSITGLLLRTRTDTSGARPRVVDWRLMARYEYWIFLAWGAFGILGFVNLLFSLSNYASGLGLTAAQGSMAVAIFNLGQMFGRPSVGLLADVVGRINMAIIAPSISFFLCFAMWIPCSNYATLIAFCLLSGFVSGNFWVIVAPVATEVVGLPNLSAGLTMMWVVFSVPATFSESIGLELRRPANSNPYLYPQLFAGCMFIGAALAGAGLRAWKIGRLEAKRVYASVKLEGNGEKGGGEGGAVAVTGRGGWGGFLSWKKV